jgi:aldehyde dehydrogenase (NAD+)
VFDDADLDAALPFLVNAGIQNAGQTCSAASRILVQRGVYDAVAERMAARYRALRVGPALDDPDVGPLISARQRELVGGYLGLIGERGVELLAQPAIPDGPGYWVPPTLVGGTDATHRLAQEEIFGPLLPLIPFDDEAEALAIANGTDYGLVAGVWTRDGSRAYRMGRALQCGQVFVNNYGAGGGIELPFGGVKRSGHGREKGFEALYGFSVLKTVAIRHG